MRILQVCNKYPFPSKDGGTIAITSLAESIHQLGHEVSLLAMITPKHGWHDSGYPSDSAYKAIYTVKVDTKINPLNLIFNLLFSDFPYNARRFISSDFHGKLKEILEQNEYQIIQLEGLYLMPYCETIRKYSKGRIVLRAHNIEQEIWRRMADNSKNRITRCYFSVLAGRMARFEASCINSYDMLIPISRRDQSCFEKMGNVRPSHVIPFGMDMSKVIPSSGNHEKNALFFIGSLDYIPNQEGLIWFIEKVWEKINLKNKSITFYVAGRNAPRRLASFCAVNGVTFLGEVDNARLLMHSKGLMVVPLLSGGGIRVKIIEAMASGIPVVSTSIGAEGLDVTNGRNILIADDPDDFANAVLNVLENQTFFTNIGENARNFIREKMDGKILAADLMTFYSDKLA